MNKEINKQLIEKQAKEILDKFAKALGEVEKKGEEDSYVDREEFEREERARGCNVDNKFKEKVLKNAPNHDDDFVIAETGSWK